MNLLIAYFHQAFAPDNSKEKKIASEISNYANNFGYKVEILPIPFDLNQVKDLKLIYSYNSLLIDNTSVLISINSPACYFSHIKHYSVWTKIPELLLPKLLSSLAIVFLLDKSLDKKKIKNKLPKTKFENYSQIKKLLKKL